MKDIMGIMKQAQAMQQRMQEMQAELERTEVTGQSGGGMVTVTLTAKGAMKGVVIDASLMKPEEKEIVEDLILTAVGVAGALGITLLLASVITPSFSALEAQAITRAPISLPSSTAAMPTPPPAPSTSRRTFRKRFHLSASGVKPMILKARS